MRDVNLIPMQGLGEVARRYCYPAAVPAVAQRWVNERNVEARVGERLRTCCPRRGGVIEDVERGGTDLGGVEEAAARRGGVNAGVHRRVLQAPHLRLGLGFE